MTEDKSKALSGPDLRSGLEFASLVENEPLLGHFDGEAVFSSGKAIRHSRWALPVPNGVAVWLLGLIINFLIFPGFFDIALRDFGLALGALALGRLTKEYSS